VPRVTKTPSTSSGLLPGDELEARIGQLWFWEGFFVRRGINLQRYYYPQPLQVTDLDLLAFEFGPTLQRRKFIGEAKSGTGKSAAAPLDRIVWLRGLMELTRADGAELTMASTIPLNTRDMAASLGIVAQSTQDLERREHQAHVRDVNDLGSHGPMAVTDLKKVHLYCKNDPELERAFWFLRTEAWLLDPWLTIKRTMTVLEYMAKRWVPGITEDESFAIRWLLCEGVCVMALNTITVARNAIILDGPLYTEHVSEHLAEGLAPVGVMTRVADTVDKFIIGVLSQIQAPPSLQVDALGAFLPTPPRYSEPFIELTQRLANGVVYARQVPRFLDLVLFERVVRQRDVPPLVFRRLGLPSATGVARAARLIVSFLRGQANLPEMIGDALQGLPFETQQFSVAVTIPSQAKVTQTEPDVLTDVTQDGRPLNTNVQEADTSRAAIRGKHEDEISEQPVAGTNIALRGTTESEDASTADSTGKATMSLDEFFESTANEPIDPVREDDQHIK